MTPVFQVGILLILVFVLGTLSTDIILHLYNSFGIGGLILGILSISLITIVVFQYWYRRKARQTLLRVLRALNPEQQEQLLQKFTPKVRSELVDQLKNTKNAA